MVGLKGTARLCLLLWPAQAISYPLQGVTGRWAVYGARIEAVTKTNKSLDKIKAATLEEMPTVKKVPAWVKQEGESITYQGADLKKHSQALVFMKSNHEQWVEAVAACLLNRVKAQDAELRLLTHAVTLLATNGWEHTETPSFGHDSLEAICDWFCVPLERSKMPACWCKKSGMIWWSTANSI